MASTAVTAISGRSQLCQSGVRFSSTSAHHPLSAIAPASAARAHHFARSAHSTVLPMPISAPIAGASATA